MSSKNTLIIVDGDQIKIIFGNKLKCIRFDEAHLDYNADFIDAIFFNTNVVKVDKISRITREEWDKFLSGRTSPAAPHPQVQSPATHQEPRPQRTAASMPRNPHVSDPMLPSEEKQIPGYYPQETNSSSYIVSMDERMTIIVEDVKTGRKINREGLSEEEALVLQPGKPVNLASLEQTSVKKSTQFGTLGRLLRNGTVRQVSYDEAMKMLSAYEQKASQVLSAFDWKGSIIGDGATGSAAKLAQNMFDGDDIPTIEVESSRDGRRPRAPSLNPENDDFNPADIMANEDPGSLDDLMDIMNQAEAEGALQPQRKTYTGFRRPGGA